MEFCNQCNLDRGIRIFNIESQRPVGDMEDFSKVLDDGTPVIPRCFKVTTEGVEGSQEIIIQHVSEAETVGNSFNDSWGLF